MGALRYLRSQTVFKQILKSCKKYANLFSIVACKISAEGCHSVNYSSLLASPSSYDLQYLVKATTSSSYNAYLFLPWRLLGFSRGLSHGLITHPLQPFLVFSDSHHLHLWCFHFFLSLFSDWACWILGGGKVAYKFFILFQHIYIFYIHTWFIGFNKLWTVRWLDNCLVVNFLDFI